MEFDDKNDNSENNENKILKKELEIISEEKNINCSEENTNNKFNKTLSKNKSENKNKNLKYSPKYLFEKEENLENENKTENKTWDLVNCLSDTKDKNITIEEEMQINSNNNMNNNLLSKSYSEITDLKAFKEGIDNNKLEFPLSNRTNISDNSKEEKAKEKNKESLSKKGALKILELLTSKKKEKEEIEKKKEELIIETFKKARNDKDNITITNNNNNENEKINDNNIINEDKNQENKNIEYSDKKIDNKEEANNNINKEKKEENDLKKQESNDDIIKTEENKEINKKEESNEKENKSVNENNDDNKIDDIILSPDKSNNKIMSSESINSNINKEPNINKIIQKPNNTKHKLYVKNSRKFIKKQINPPNKKNLLKNSFSITREKKQNIIKQKRNKDSSEEPIFRYKSFKQNSNTIVNQNKTLKNLNKKIKKGRIEDENKNTKENFNSVNVYKKQSLSKSPKGEIYAPRKALNPRGSSINKYNSNSILGKSNININNLNYINNINTIIKNKNDSNFNDSYNDNNILKLNNSLNINTNNNYNTFLNNYNCIDNYTKYNKNTSNYNIIRNFNSSSNFINNNNNHKKILIGTKNYNNNNGVNIRQKFVNDNEEFDFSKENIKYNKNSFQLNPTKDLLLNRLTPDKNISKKNNKYKNNLMSNPERNLKNPKTIPSIYQNKYNQNINNLSQRYYIYNSNQEINNNENTNKFSYYDLNNDIITTEGTNTNTNNKINDYLIDYDLYNNIHLSKNSSISINIEDLMIFEEKFSEIIFFLKNGKEAKNQCFDFWNYFFNCSLFEKIEKIFKTEKNIEIAKFSINLELISVMITYEFSFDFDILNKSNILLLEILELSHRNLMIICENILMKIIPENQKNIWVLKLNNLVQNSKKYFPKNYSNLSHIDLINKNSLELSNKLQNIFSLFETESSPLINSLFKKIHQKSYTEINDFFIEYILKIENQESSIIAPLLLSSNPNFNSFRPPYIHTERIKQYTLILDLNDTIVNFQQTNNSQGILRLRPFLIEFLEQINLYYELILFTTSTEYFSKPIINAIEENKKYFDFIFYREYAIIVGNDFVKDLTRVGRPLDSTIIVDNMPQNFRLQKENGIHIKPFYAQDPNDNTLIELMDILINIANSGIDVREGLANYRNDIVQKVTSDIAKYDN